MANHLRKELDKLNQQLLALGITVEETLEKSIRSLLSANAPLAREVVESDNEIDEREVDIEEECLKILALHQPVAIDLRYIVAAMKINSDLERIGDLAVSIAHKSEYLAGLAPSQFVRDLSAMADAVRQMLRQSIESFVNQDSDLARRVCREDNTIDELHSAIRDRIEASIRGDVDRVDEYLRLIGISRNLERVADHATNIAEDTIYLREGQIVRHRMSKES